MFRFKVHEVNHHGKPEEKKNWWENLPDDLRDKEVVNKDMKEKLGGVSDIMAKNGNAHIPDMLFD